MMVVIRPGSGCALTATSMTRKISLTQIVLVNFVSSSGFDFTLTVMGRLISSLLVISYQALESRTFRWPIQRLHTH